MKKLVARFTALVMGLILCYAVFTPVGALRAGVLLSGHPVSAVTMGVREATADDVGLKKLDNPAGTTIYHVYENTPYAENTATHMKNWIVQQYGPIHVAAYYGYC